MIPFSWETSQIVRLAIHIEKQNSFPYLGCHHIWEITHAGGNICRFHRLWEHVCRFHRLWEHAWSSGKVQDSWSLDHQYCEFEPRYGQRVCVPGQDNLLRWPERIWDLSVVGNVTIKVWASVDRACAWPAANRPRWSAMIVTISWRGNNNRQQRFDLMENALYKSNYYYYYYMYSHGVQWTCTFFTTLTCQEEVCRTIPDLNSCLTPNSLTPIL